MDERIPMKNPDMVERQSVMNPVEIEIYSWIMESWSNYFLNHFYNSPHDFVILEQGSEIGSQGFHFEEKEKPNW